MKKKSIKKITDLIIMSFSLGIFFIIWELFVKYSDISSIVLVAPSEILPVITDNYETLTKELKYTSEEVLYGWFWGNLIALVTSIIIFSYKKISDSVISLGVIVNAVPLIALAAILGGFIGTDQNAKTIIVAILCFFPMLVVTTTAFKRVNGDYKRLFVSYNSSKKTTFIKLIFPASLPAIFTVLKLNVINAITTAIVSEFFGAHGGIGQFILARKGFYDLPMVWAGIFFIVISGSIFYFSIDLAKKLFIKWH
jgi:NitT/TauT family transport system permease protein